MVSLDSLVRNRSADSPSADELVAWIKLVVLFPADAPENKDSPILNLLEDMRAIDKETTYSRFLSYIIKLMTESDDFGCNWPELQVACKTIADNQSIMLLLKLGYRELKTVRDLIVAICGHLNKHNDITLLKLFESFSDEAIRKIHIAELGESFANDLRLLTMLADIGLIPHPHGRSLKEYFSAQSFAQMLVLKAPGSLIELQNLVTCSLALYVGDTRNFYLRLSVLLRENKPITETPQVIVNPPPTLWELDGRLRKLELKNNEKPSPLAMGFLADGLSHLIEDSRFHREGRDSAAMAKSYQQIHTALDNLFPNEERLKGVMKTLKHMSQ